jgi:hypothetical protein
MAPAAASVRLVKMCDIRVCITWPEKTRYISQISIDDVEIFDEWFEMEIVQQRGRESGTGRHTYSYNTDIACRPTERRNQSVHAIIHLVNLPLPNEDLGRPKKPFRTRFRSIFQGREYSIWATKR